MKFIKKLLLVFVFSIFQLAETVTVASELWKYGVILE